MAVNKSTIVLGVSIERVYAIKNKGIYRFYYENILLTGYLLLGRLLGFSELLFMLRLW